MKISDLQKLIPLYLLRKLTKEEGEEMHQHLETGELREDLRFWQRVRRILQLERASESAGHLTAEEVVDYIEKRLPATSRRTAIESHLAECSNCREDVAILKETYPRATPQRAILPGMIDSLIEFLKPARVGYATAAVAIFVLIGGLLLLFREPEWQRHKGSGDRFLREGKYTEAVTEYERALTALDATKEHQPEESASILENLASAELRLGNMESARTSFESVLELRETIPGKDSISLLRVLDQLASLHSREDHFVEAENLHRRADQIRSLVNQRSPATFPDRRSTRFALLPQILLRGPETEQQLPQLRVEEELTDVELRVSLGRPTVPAAEYVFSIGTPSGKLLPVLDTLSTTKPNDTLTFMVSTRYFRERPGTYRLRVHEQFVRRDGELQTRTFSYLFRVTE